MEQRLGPRRPGGVAVEDVSRRFRSVVVLRDVRFEVGPGEVAAVIGPNGSGKTTLLRILAGVLAPTGGRVEVAGGPAGRGEVGYVLAGDRGLYWRLTGEQNLEFFAGIARIPRADARWRARAAMASLGAEALLAKRVGVCSAGQRRRVAIARGFVSGSPVVLVDEPYSDLDEEGCAQVGALFRSWAGAGGTVLYAAPKLEAGPEPDVLFRLADGTMTSASPVERPSASG